MKKTPRPCSFATRLFRASMRTCQVLSMAAFAVAARAETVVFDASGSFVVPAGVTNVSVEVWGGGGGGGYDSAASSRDGAAGGGGGGGGYAKRVAVPVTPGQSYRVLVGDGGLGVVASRRRTGSIAGGASAVGGSSGQAGGDSSFEGDAGVRVLARGGAGASSDAGGSGGAPGLGDAGLVFAGGNGGDGSTNAGGGGGGAAQADARGTNGSDGSGVTGGNGGAVGGGKGGNKDGAGQHGSSPGAGGGGNGRDGAAAGNGAAGRVAITYTVQLAPEVQTGLMLDDEDGMVGGGMLYRPMPGVINADGSYAVQAFAKVGVAGVTVANDELLLTNRSGSLRVVAREGSPLPGGGHLANGLIHLAMSGQGKVLAVNNVRATAAVGAITGTASLLSSDGIDLELVKRKGGVLPAGGTLLMNVANLLPYGGVNLSYACKLSGVPVTRDTRVDSEHSDGSNPQILACEGDDVTSLLGDPAWLGEIGRQFGTGGEEVAFVARLQNNPANLKQRTLVTANEALFCVSENKTLKQLLRKGTTVPDTNGAKIQMFSGLSRARDSRARDCMHAVHVMLDQPRLRAINQALIHLDEGVMHLVAQMGVTKITSGLTIGRFGQYYAANDGSVVFTAWLAGAPVTSDGVLCRWTLDGGIEVIAREGDAAPHTDRLYGTLTRLSVSPSGVVLFQATLTGVGGNGIVYRLKEGVLEKLVRVGDDITFDGESTKVLGLGIYDTVAGGGSSARAAVNDAGQALVALSLGNGRHVNRVFE